MWVIKFKCRWSNFSLQIVYKQSFKVKHKFQLMFYYKFFWKISNHHKHSRKIALCPPDAPSPLFAAIQMTKFNRLQVSIIFDSRSFTVQRLKCPLLTDSKCYGDVGLKKIFTASCLPKKFPNAVLGLKACYQCHSSPWWYVTIVKTCACNVYVGCRILMMFRWSWWATSVTWKRSELSAKNRASTLPETSTVLSWRLLLKLKLMLTM